MKRLVLAMSFLLMGLPVQAQELKKETFNLIRQPKYLSYDEGVAKANREKKVLVVARNVSGKKLAERAKLAELNGDVFAVANANDTRVPEGISEWVGVPASVSTSTFTPPEDDPFMSYPTLVEGLRKGVRSNQGLLVVRKVPRKDLPYYENHARSSNLILCIADDNDGRFIVGGVKYFDIHDVPGAPARQQYQYQYPQYQQTQQPVYSSGSC
jgi:hypothetical protein